MSHSRPEPAQRSGSTTSAWAAVNHASSRVGLRRSIRGPQAIPTSTAGTSSARNTVEVASAEPELRSTTNGRAMNINQSPTSDTTTVAQSRRRAPSFWRRAAPRSGLGVLSANVARLSWSLWMSERQKSKPRSVSVARRAVPGRGDVRPDELIDAVGELGQFGCGDAQRVVVVCLSCAPGLGLPVMATTSLPGQLLLT